MKQGKRTKSAAPLDTELDVAAVAPPELPDAAYVDQLLAASAPVVEAVVSEVAAVVDDVDTVVIEQPVVAAEKVAEPTAASVTSMLGEVIALPAQCLLRDAVEFKQTFLNCLHADAVVVDVGAVERIDTAFMQVLLALSSSRADGGNEKVSWVNVNKAFADAVRILGLQSALSIPNLDVAA